MAMTLAELVARSYQQAVDNGWTVKDVTIPEQIALLHSEISEAMESWRNGEVMSWTDKDGKPQGIGSEFADELIRIGHYSKLNGIDIEYEVKRKLEYNATRGYRHGGKLA